MAHREFETNGRLGKILKRMDIVQKSNYSLEKTKYGDDDDESNNASDFYGKLKEFFLDSDIALPSSKPVHPMPDFKSYIP